MSVNNEDSQHETDPKSQLWQEGKMVPKKPKGKKLRGDIAKIMTLGQDAFLVVRLSDRDAVPEHIDKILIKPVSKSKDKEYVVPADGMCCENVCCENQCCDGLCPAQS